MNIRLKPTRITESGILGFAWGWLAGVLCSCAFFLMVEWAV